MDLDRIHKRLDIQISQLSKLAERVVRAESQELLSVELRKDVERMSTRIDSLVDRVTKLELQAAQESGGRDKSKLAEYAAKGGLVLSGGAVVEALRQIVDLLKDR
jgi:hypothetical protein